MKKLLLPKLIAVIALGVLVVPAQADWPYQSQPVYAPNYYYPTYPTPTYPTIVFVRDALHYPPPYYYGFRQLPYCWYCRVNYVDPFNYPDMDMPVTTISAAPYAPVTSSVPAIAKPKVAAPAVKEKLK